VKLTRVAI